MSARFIHLRLHTEFSLTDGLIKIKPLMQAVLDSDMPAVAVTDQSALYSLIKFYNAANETGIKPICGADVWVGDHHSVYRIVLLCMNAAGYRNLTTLISRSFLENQQNGKAIIKRQWLFDNNQGLIALSGGREGDIGVALLSNKYESANQLLQLWMHAFPLRFYLELQRTQRQGEDSYICGAVKLAAEHQCPVVATNEVVFLYEDAFDAHEARVCIGSSAVIDDATREKKYTPSQWFKSAEEMCTLFQDIPEALDNTIEIAKRCNLELTLDAHFLPEFPLSNEHTINSYFREFSLNGLNKRLELILDKNAPDYNNKKQQYYDRLEFELKTIIQMGFPGYFLIVMDFIRWSKEQGIPVGPGRGSGAGSLVAYSQGITDIDPLRYNLLFERFLNPERVSMPDFDIDFCIDGRDRVIEYVADKYGKQAVAQIITFGSMAAKAVIRDVARVQGKSYSLANRLSKMIPFELGITLDKAYDQEKAIQSFIKEDADGAEIWEMAKHLEGITRNVGKHAGGVIIAPTKLTDFVPLFSDEYGQGVVTQFDKNDVEAVGLVKFDFLGLRTLTTINWTVQSINKVRARNQETLLDINQLDLTDQSAFDFLQTGATTAIFQLESDGMKELIHRLKPDCFEDIIALVALFRPGPLQSGMVDNFINRKHNNEVISYPDKKYQHKSLKPILEPTYGIILYQEQVMQIAQILAGYTLGGADMLRRAMGKKKPEEMEKQRNIFQAGALKNNIDSELAMKIFDLVEKFAGYGFNKSHSAAYALISYQTLWLKKHYPAEFMAAILSSEMQNTDKIVIFIEECKALGISVLSPDLNSSSFMFDVNESGKIVYGLGAIKGLGEGPVETIIKARKKVGKFKDIFDFCQQIDLKKINKRALDALIRSGAADSLIPPLLFAGDYNKMRAVLEATQQQAVKAAEQIRHNQASGHNDLFGSYDTNHVFSYDSYDHVAPWSDKKRLKAERDILGFYQTGHPLDEYKNELMSLGCYRIGDLQAAKKRSQYVGGLIIKVTMKRTKKGDKMAFIVLEDETGRIELSVFSDVYARYSHLIIKDMAIIVEGEVAYNNYAKGLQINVRNLMEVKDMRLQKAKKLILSLSSSQLFQITMPCFKKMLLQHIGLLPIAINYYNQYGSARFVLGDAWKITPSDDFLQACRNRFGSNAVSLDYGKDKNTY